MLPADRAQKQRALAAYLVAGARSGRARDFSALVRLFDARLRNHARRLSDDADTARDIVQEAWAAIARGLSGLRDDSAFLPWALRIVTRFAARDVARRQRHRRAEAGHAENLRHQAEETRPDPPDLAAALATLPAAHRATLALFYLEEMSVAEVAVALDIPPGTVKSRLLHARRKLRDHLEGESDGST
ncbi:MAG: sigma-70 family RNA polymerase sigma factor [Pararhodobacter sp.]|nr:sigma-70 family RNA polymerase sigma factor [Pararhodobacter sp.]